MEALLFEGLTSWMWLLDLEPAIKVHTSQIGNLLLIFIAPYWAELSEGARMWAE